VLTSKLEASQVRIRERWYPHFAWSLNDSVPWSELSRSLSEATVALVSTCGLYECDSQLPFQAWNDLGDPSYREIHLDTPSERLRIAHSHYNHEQVGRDAGVSLPFSHFDQLQRDGRVGRLHPVAYSFMGYLPEPRQLIRETAPQVARRLVGAGVHAAFLTPC
jgi:D-proline reductase (dithiol) PrdB